MDCDEEREGYVKQTAPAYPVIHAAPADGAQQHGLNTRTEEAIAGLIGIAGGVWAVYVVIVEQASPWHFHINPPGPAEFCALAVLIWLHAKWRHAWGKGQ